MSWALCALLAAAASPSTLPQGPVSFTADVVTMDPRVRRALLEGKVHLERGDLIVLGDHAVAELMPPADAQPAVRSRRDARKERSPLPGIGKQDLRRFTVDGSVHVTRQSRTADGAHAEYDGVAQTLLLTGANQSAAKGTPEAEGPVLRDGPELLLGDRILLHLDSDDVEVARPRLVLQRSPAAGKEPPASGAAAPPVVPVRVEARRLHLDSGRRIARFADDVVLRRGDMTVRGPLLDARYDRQGDLTNMIVSGGVELEEGDRRATGRQAVYDAVTRKVVLTGDPKLYDRGDQLAGERIEMALDSHEVKVDRARGRLRPERHQGEDGAP
ncbi:MAG TPA: LptA/OstA family protein [Myxococcales bacterium]|nr:LptA/OstA family protein [Myxococcales bacterium]